MFSLHAQTACPAGLKAKMQGHYRLAMTNRKQHVRSCRPKLPAESLRTKTIGVRVNAAELAAIQAKAAQVGLPPAQWLRTAALSQAVLRPLVPEINRQAYAELTRLAANLNQMARAAHAGQIVSASGLLEILQRQVRLLRKELLGIGHDSENHKG